MEEQKKVLRRWGVGGTCLLFSNLLSRLVTKLDAAYKAHRKPTPQPPFHVMSENAQKGDVKMT